MKNPTAAELLKAARDRARLTQEQMAQLAGTSQSAIAAYEAGDREPSVPVLKRMLGATGHRLVLNIEPDVAVYRLADLANDISQTDITHTESRLRLVFEFLRGAQDDEVPAALLTAVKPESTGDDRFDALLGAIAEDLCVHNGVVPPAWALEDSRFLNNAWWVSTLPSARARALVHAPASFRRRGVMIDRSDLVST